MQGVRLVRTPPRNIAGSARSGLERSGNIAVEERGKRGSYIVPRLADAVQFPDVFGIDPATARAAVPDRIDRD
jgi:hypothetical protein